MSKIKEWCDFNVEDVYKYLWISTLSICVTLIMYTLSNIGKKQRINDLEHRNTELDAQIIRLEHSLDLTDKALIELRQEFNELKYEYTLHKRHPVKAQ